MRILVLGATGMLGHRLMQSLALHHDVAGTVRGPAGDCAPYPVFSGKTLLGRVQAEDFDSVTRAVASHRPAAIVNAIGVIKQRPEAQDPVTALTINSLFPHRLGALCRAAGIRLIHLSTDCVFSGRKGRYRESDPADAEDLYGRTKLLGEIGSPGCLTLRTSMVGRELGTRFGLVEWLISNRGGSVSGYARAVFSGLTTAVLADLIRHVLEERPGLEGIWHAASEPIDKFRLLGLINERMNLGIAIARDESFACDRSLDGARLSAAAGWTAPGWPEMISRMAADLTPYGEIHAGKP